jgi:hypothetical protein
VVLCNPKPLCVSEREGVEQIRTKNESCEERMMHCGGRGRMGLKPLIFLKPYGETVTFEAYERLGLHDNFSSNSALFFFFLFF